MVKIGHILMFNEELLNKFLNLLGRLCTAIFLTKYQLHEHAQYMHMAHIRNTLYVICYLFYIP